MAVDPNIQRYLDFMQWFEKQHPDLHGAHWAAISIPVSGKGNTVKISPGKLGKTTIKRIKAAINDYYNNDTSKNQGM